MRTTQPFTNTVPINMAEAMERWLREEVAAGHKEYLADPSKGARADAVLHRIKARRAAPKAQ